MTGVMTGTRPRALMLRYAWRDLRGGWRSFGVFLACIALGVMAIAGVGSVAGSLQDGLAREGRTILGGDIKLLAVLRIKLGFLTCGLEDRGLTIFETSSHGDRHLRCYKTGGCHRTCFC